MSLSFRSIASIVYFPIFAEKQRKLIIELLLVENAHVHNRLNGCLSTHYPIHHCAFIYSAILKSSYHRACSKLQITQERTIINPFKEMCMSLFCLNSHDIALKMENNKQNMLLKMFSMLFSYCNLWRDSRYYTRVCTENKTIVVTLMTINKVNGIENAFLLELNELFWMLTLVLLCVLYCITNRQMNSLLLLNFIEITKRATICCSCPAVVMFQSNFWMGTEIRRGIKKPPSSFKNYNNTTNTFIDYTQTVLMHINLFI